MGWYDNLPSIDRTLALMSPAGLAVIHTQPFATGNWVCYDYMRHIEEQLMPVFMEGGKAMVSMPPRHGKSTYCSTYVAAWFVMTHRTLNVILTGYAGDLPQGFSKKAREVVRQMGHLFGCRINPNQNRGDHWQIEYLNDDGEWIPGGNVYATGIDGALPGRGASLIVMDDVVRGHTDTGGVSLGKIYELYRGVIETRLEPIAPGVPGAMLLVMTRWAAADIAGRLKEDEGDQWKQVVLPALAEKDDVLGREEGEALCPERYSREWLEQKRDSSNEGGILFSALYQQDPIPEDGAVFIRNDIGEWERHGDILTFGSSTCNWDELTHHFVTIDPALKAKQANDETGFIHWALTPCAKLLLLDDETKRMRGSTDLIPLMKRFHVERKSIRFYVESAAHGTEIIRACERKMLPVYELIADRDKLTRAIGAQPAFAAGKVFFPKRGAEKVIRQMLEFPTGLHDDRVDCVAYAVPVYHELVSRMFALDQAKLREGLMDESESKITDYDDDADWSEDDDKDAAGRWIS